MRRGTAWLCMLGSLISGLLVGLAMPRYNPATVDYRYEQLVEVTGGFYRGRVGVVCIRDTSLLGYRTYVLRLQSGELAFNIAESDLKPAAAAGNDRDESDGYGTGY